MKPIRNSFGGDSYKLFEDYNDVHLFVEDAGFENLYQAVCRNNGLRIEQVFSLTGKQSVIDKARQSRDKKCVFLIDKDWDDLLGIKIKTKRIVVLEKHSIENYLINYAGISQYVMGEHPRKQIATILSDTDFQEILFSISDALRPLFECFAQIQKDKTEVSNCSMSPGRFQEKNASRLPDKNLITEYVNRINIPISKKIKKYFNTPNLVARGHGKYMLHYVWAAVRAKVKLRDVGIDELMLRIAQLSQTSDLQTLTDAIRKKVQDGRLKS